MELQGCRGPWYTKGSDAHKAVTAAVSQLSLRLHWKQRGLREWGAARQEATPML